MSKESTPESRRIERLEADLLDLQRRLRKLEPIASRPHDERMAAAIDRRRYSRWTFHGEQWTGRVGLVLVFLGLVFLFRFSIEQGWITPTVRVVFGGSLATLFLVLGLRSSLKRPSYGSILLAGSVASFYATGWAASYLYAMLERPAGMLWMAAVTVLAFVLASRFGRPVLASMGALGGFATPFLLDATAASATELVAYTLLVAAWPAATYVRRRWTSVLWTYLTGGLSVLAVAGLRANEAELWLVQAALVALWLAGAGYPFIQEAKQAGDADPKPRALIPFALQLRTLGVGGTGAMLLLSSEIWDLSQVGTGLLFLAFALAYGAFAWIGTRKPNFVARNAAPVAAALLATGIFLGLGDSPARWAAVGMLGALYLRGGSTSRFRGLEWVAHGSFALIAAEMVRYSFWGSSVGFEGKAWALILSIALAAAGSIWLPSAKLRLAYRISAHSLAILWSAVQFATLSEGGEWITIIWCAYGILLLLTALEYGRYRNLYLLQMQAFGASALALSVAKLLIVDLAQLSPLIRIPLFLGSGFALMAVSARFQASRPRRPVSRPVVSQPNATVEIA